MSRLSDKLAAAAAVAPRQAAKLEARADKIIAMEPALEKEADDAFGPHEALLAEAEASIHDVKHQLAGFANGNPSPASTDSQAGGTSSSQ